MSKSNATIVIPLLNQVDAWLEQCVRSALEQTVKAEVIVVISPLTCDSNLAVLQNIGVEQKSLKIITRPPGSQFAGAINAGFAAADCERVGLLLSDDWLEEDALEACLARSEDLVATGRIAYDADGHTKLWENLPKVSRYATLADDESRASYIGHFMVFRRERFQAVGGVDPDIGLTGADDYDLPWCLIEAGATVGLVERGLYNYRDHEQQRLTLRNRESQVHDLVRLLAKHGIENERAEELIRGKQKWFGEPVYRVLAQIERTQAVVPDPSPEP